MQFVSLDSQDSNMLYQTYTEDAIVETVGKSLRRDIMKYSHFCFLAFLSLKVGNDVKATVRDSLILS